MFRLSKWYLDCVADDGEAGIGYSGLISCNRAKLGFSAFIHAPRGAPTTQMDCWTSEDPILSKDSVKWRCRRLGVSGCWRRGRGTGEFELLDSPEGRITWACLSSEGDVRVLRRGSRAMMGRGYVERLTITIPPWRFPFRQLLWGRFVPDKPGPSVAWLDWRGGLNRQWCFVDGLRTGPAEVGRRGVRGEGWHIRLQDESVMQSARIAEVVLGPFAPIAKLLPSGFSNARETKWLSRAEFSRPGTPHTEGWVIHEVVQWR